MEELQKLLRKEINALEHANKLLGIAFEKMLGTPNFNSNLAIDVILKREVINNELCQCRAILQIHASREFAEFDVFEHSLNALLGELEIPYQKAGQ